MVIFISLIVILLCLFIAYNNFSKNKNSLYLCGSLIVMAIIGIVQMLTLDSKNKFWIALLFGHFLPLSYLIGPFFYFYVRNTIRDSVKLSRLDYLHFLPFVICLISILPYYFTDFDSKLRFAQLFIDKTSLVYSVNISWLYPSYINILLRPFVLFGYSLSSLIVLVKFLKKKNSLTFNKKQEDIAIKWLFIINFIFITIALGFCGSIIQFIPIIKKTTSEQIDNSFISHILAILYSLIPILIIIFPEILYGLHVKTKKKVVKLKYKNDHELLVISAALILEFIKKKKNLINPNFSIDDICVALKLKRKDVQYCFKTILETKFSTLKKELRVEIAKKELINGKLATYSMEGVWINSGFSSKTSFFVSFKEITGMTPLEYLKSLEYEYS